MTFEEDPELLARLMAADPAAHLPPADPSRVARLLEDTMNTPHTEADAARSDHPAPVRGPGHPDGATARKPAPRHNGH